jgi:hypothetical protein
LQQFAGAAQHANDDIHFLLKINRTIIRIKRR